MKNSGFKGCSFVCMVFLGLLIGITQNIPFFIYLFSAIIVIGILIAVFDNGK